MVPLAEPRSGSLQAATSGDLKVAATSAIVPIYIILNIDIRYLPVFPLLLPLRITGLPGKTLLLTCRAVTGN